MATWGYIIILKAHDRSLGWLMHTKEQRIQYQEVNSTKVQDVES
jgi:hypothetical protein